MPAVVTRAHAAGEGTIRVHQAAADMNSSAVLLGFSFEREHRPDWRMAFGALRDVKSITVPRNRSVGLRASGALAERQCGRALALQPGFAPAHRQGGKRLAPSRGGLETPAELPHRLDPSFANDAQPFQDRGNLVRDRPALAGPKLPARPFQKCLSLAKCAKPSAERITASLS